MLLFKSIHNKLDAIISQNDLIVLQNGAIIDCLLLILAKEDKLMTNLVSLTAALTAETDAVKAAVALITSLAEQIKAVSADQAAVDALADQFLAQSKILAAAVAANTPAAPVVAPVDPVVDTPAV